MSSTASEQGNKKAKESKRAAPDARILIIVQNLHSTGGPGWSAGRSFLLATKLLWYARKAVTIPHSR